MIIINSINDDSAVKMTGLKFQNLSEEFCMSLINTEIKPFKATAYHNGKFVPVTNFPLLKASALNGLISVLIRDMGAPKGLIIGMPHHSPGFPDL